MKARLTDKGYCVAPLRCLLLLIYCCFSATAVAAENLVLQLRGPHQAQFIGYYVAKEKGFYQQQGLNVTIKAGQPGIIPWQEIMSNRADFAIDNSNALNAYLFGEPLVALAAIYQYSPSSLIATQEDIRTITDLKYKRIMMFPGAQDPELLLMLTKAGIEKQHIQLIATSADLNDLISNRIDAFNSYQTRESYALEHANIPYRQFIPSDFDINFYSDILLTSQHMATQQPEITERFRDASLKGWQYALNRPEEALALLRQNYPSQRSLEELRFEMTKSLEFIMPELVEIGHMNMQRWERMSEILISSGLARHQRSLKDFVYQDQNYFDWRAWMPWIYTGATTIAALTLLSFYLYSLNRRLKREIAIRHATEEKLKHLATHDPLTGLANRSALAAQLDTLLKLAKRNKLTPAILYIDLDGFKAINDTLGHAAGDRVLIRFVKRVQIKLRESDIFARLGGDEFLILLDHSSREGAHHLAKKILDSFEHPFIIKNTRNRMSASIGIALYQDYRESPEAFMIRADKAMYHIKRNGKSGIGIAAPFRGNESNDLQSTG